MSPIKLYSPGLYAVFSRIHQPNEQLHFSTVLLSSLPAPEHVVLHYLGGRVEVEVFLAHDVFADISGLRAAEAMLAERIKDHPAIRSISLNFRIAPE